MTVQKIVITGGPCAGKTTALSRIHDVYTDMGYTVLFVPETATELICGGVSPTSCGTNEVFQSCLVKLQLAKEEVFANAAATMDGEKLLIVCDRGLLDNKAYMTEEEFCRVTEDVGMSEVVMRDSYDAVFHLVTAAKGAAEYYSVKNNSARTEDIATAAMLDDRLISAWTGHPHFRIIGNAGDFEDKLSTLIGEISAFLGEPEPAEIERKYLIEYPSLSLLEADPFCRRVEISQTYLTSPAGDELRVRRRGCDGSFVYFKTTKRRTDGYLKRVEIEERITEKEYLGLLRDADPSCRTIEKTRYCLSYEGQYFEIDVYPFWSDRAIMEIELAREDASVSVPEYIKVIREVTEDASYKNSSLARAKVLP